MHLSSKADGLHVFSATECSQELTRPSIMDAEGEWMARESLTRHTAYICTTTGSISMRVNITSEQEQ